MIFRVDNIDFSYKSVPTLENITFSLEKGDVLSLLGPNGVGKTTLMKCINRILMPSNGSVFIGDENISDLSRRNVAKRIGYVPQRGDVSRMSVFDSILLGRMPHMGWDASNKDIMITGRVIDLIGLQKIAMKYINEISGGEYQLVQIARALVQQPQVILLDEPTSNLDLCNQHMIMKVMNKVVKVNEMAAVMVIHDINLALRYSDKFILLKEGKIFAAGGVETITSEVVSEVYNMEVSIEDVKGKPVVVPV